MAAFGRTLERRQAPLDHKDAPTAVGAQAARSPPSKRRERGREKSVVAAVPHWPTRARRSCLGSGGQTTGQERGGWKRARGRHAKRWRGASAERGKSRGQPSAFREGRSRGRAGVTRPSQTCGTCQRSLWCSARGGCSYAAAGRAPRGRTATRCSWAPRLACT